MSFDQKTVQNISNLARINLDEAAQEKFTTEIEGILEWVRQLQEVNVEGVEPLISVSEQKSAERADVVTDGNIRDDLMKNAPESAHGFFVVPKMVE